MAKDSENKAVRGVGRILQLLGVTSSAEISDTGTKSPADNLNYGVFSADELRHLAGVSSSIPTMLGKKPVPRENAILTYLEQVSDNTHTKIEELRNLTIVAPEIKLSKRVIVSTIMSPQDLQTNVVNISMDYEGLSEEIKNDLLEKLNTFFNKEYHLASKLNDWLQTAGFEEGSKSILVLPKHELDVQNAIADVLASKENLELVESLKSIESSTEDLYIPATENAKVHLTEQQKNRHELMLNLLDAEIETSLESLGVDKFFEDHEKGFTESTEDKKTITIKNKVDLTKSLREGTLKLLRRNGDGSVVVTRDVTNITKGVKGNNDVMNQLLKDAKAQLKGFDPDNKDVSVAADIRCYSISDDIKVGDNDLPIVIEIPADAVIPVCAPRDNKNHIGYFILVDENGQPISGTNNYFKTGSTEVTNRLAMQAAKSVYGNATLTSFAQLTTNPTFMLQQMSDVFAVAVNKLLESKLSEKGLTGLNINMHNAVGKALFLNLLANNRIRMVFVPEPMLVYYRFDHREDGTGKTLLEDVSQLLALRTTFVIARLMAAVDNATLQRTVEVDIDEQETNPQQVMQMVAREAVSKYTPSFTTEVQTAAESLISRSLRIKPKSIAGTTDNLSVNVEKSYGNAQAPDTDLLEKLNNWIGMGMGGLPASVLNQLGENEFARSVATTNMYFANTVAGWQMMIEPHNKKFISLYTSSSSRLLKLIRDTISTENKGNDKDLDKNKSPEVIDEKIETRVKDIINSLNVSLPPPQMAAKKAHFEEIQSFADMIEKIVNIIYSDETVVDDDLKSNMSVIRAAITSKLLREFLPKLGCQAIADIPEPSGIDADYAKEIFMYLSNLKRRIKNAADLVKGQLPANSKASPVSTSEEPTPTGEEEQPNAEEETTQNQEEEGAALNEPPPGQGMF